MRKIIKRNQYLFLIGAVIFICAFLSPFYIQIFGGPELINIMPWPFITCGFISIAFMLLFNYSEKLNLKSVKV